MEFKKRTIIWENNNEHSKDCIWVKSDNKAYKYSYSDKCLKESGTVSIINKES